MARFGVTSLDAEHASADEFVEGFRQLRDDFDVPGEHAPEVRGAAVEASARPFDVVAPTESTAATRWQHVDRTDVPFATLDPASSTDLDQAFAVERSGSDVILRYAIADVGWFVRHGDPIDREAWRRGVTVYLPDGRAGLHPEEIAEDAGSLLPGGDKPAVVFTVRVADDGSVRLDGAERAMVRSRAKLAYSTVTPDDLPPDFPELARRIEAAETARGADRIQWPEQEVVRREGGGYDLRFRPRNESERNNAAMSLATNMAVADALWEAGTGLFRTMPPVDESRTGRLRHTARAFGLDWPKDLGLREFEKSLPRDDARTAAFQLAVRRSSGGASYTPASAYRTGETPDGATVDGRPWHAAVAATYAHATAPLRRLADRYVVEAALAIGQGRDVPDEIDGAFEDLPEVMRRSDTRANRVDRAAIDLAEAILLADRVGDTFDAVVTDEDDRGVRIQICEPAVIARTTARRVDPGDEIRVRVTSVDVSERRIDVDRIG